MEDKNHVGMLSFYLINQAFRQCDGSVKVLLAKYTSEQLIESCAKLHGYPSDISQLSQAMHFIKDTLGIGGGR